MQPVVDDNNLISNIGQSEDQDDDEEGSKSKKGSVKWMSSKMRLMQKMMNPGDDHIIPAVADKRERNIINNNTSTQFINFSFNSNNTVRVCSDCNTTTTPLWRSGPRGPKVRYIPHQFNFPSFIIIIIFDQFISIFDNFKM